MGNTTQIKKGQCRKGLCKREQQRACGKCSGRNPYKGRVLIYIDASERQRHYEECKRRKREARKPGIHHGTAHERQAYEHAWREPQAIKPRECKAQAKIMDA